MLAKQIWRLHTNHDSLISKIFKARYYPHTDVLQASIGTTPSYAWRSLHQFIRILNKGCCWQVSTGDSIDIWRDRWIPHQNGHKIITPNPSNPKIKMIKDLILDAPPPPRWNQALIEHTFLPSEGSQIQQIPITHVRTQDSIIWMFFENGEYTIKTGYQVIQVWKRNGDQGASNSDFMDTIWKKL